jgi:hypothetical protein
MHNSFNNELVIKEVVERLSDKATATPFPHLRVVGPNPNLGPNTHRLFTPFTQDPPHVIGAKVEVKKPNKNGTEAISTSTVSFFIRRSTNSRVTNAFEEITITLAADLIRDEATMEVVSSINGALQTFPLAKQGTPTLRKFVGKIQYDYELDFLSPRDNNRYQEQCQLEVVVEKILETRDASWTCEFKLRNNSRARQKVEGVIEDAPEEAKVTDTPDEPDELPTDSDFVGSLGSNQVLANYLMEFDYAESLRGTEYVSAQGGAVLRTFNVIAVDEEPNIIRFLDHYLAFEQILPLRVSSRTITEFRAHLTNVGLRFDPALINAFATEFGATPSTAHFYVYQEQAVESILREFREREKAINLISVRTAGGKTESFIAPLLQYCIDSSDRLGVKALVFYPTKALANDQAKRLFRLLYATNQEMRAGGKRAITMALYHGDIVSDLRPEEPPWIPFKCPKLCDQYLEFESRPNGHVLICRQCNCEVDWCFVTRPDSHSRLPDVLITNPDTLTLIMSRSAERQSLLGRQIRYCPECGRSTAAVRKQICDGFDCRSNLVTIKPECVPDVFIYDEVHMLNGAFGMNVSAFQKRLLKVGSELLARIDGSAKYSPVFIGASATIGEPNKFAAAFFGVDDDKVRLLPTDMNAAYDSSRKGPSRYNLFLLPRAYKSKQTGSLAVRYLLDIARREQFLPRILGFTNSLRDCNDLIMETKIRAFGLADFKVDGHNTQYDRKQRMSREIDFNKGRIHVLFATSTLEVGVDFDDINALLIFGPPFYFNDYLQRIGRAGRKSDAVVLTLCKANQAVDYWYFENSKSIASNPLRFTKAVPIGTDNEFIIRKTLILAFFDWVQLRDDITVVSEKNAILDKLFDVQRNVWLPGVAERITLYLQTAVPAATVAGITDIMQMIKVRLLKQAKDMRQSLITELHDLLNFEEGIDNLRSSEKSVEVTYIFDLKEN